MRACSICAHENRGSIEQALLQPRANKSRIAREWNVSRYCLIDHVKKHMTQPKKDNHSDVTDMLQPDGCGSEAQATRSELIKKAYELHEQALRCTASNVNMVILMRRITELLIQIVENQTNG